VKPEIDVRERTDGAPRRDESEAATDVCEWSEALLAASPVHLFGHDLEGRYVYVSAAAARALGRTSEEMVGRSWRELGLPPEVLEPFDRLRERVIATGRPVQAETTFPTVEGVRGYAYTICPVHDGEGRLVGTSTTSTDITDICRTDEALAESEERFRSAFEHAAIGMALVDLEDGRFRDANRSLCRITGYALDELRELTFAEITHPDDLDADMAEMRRLVAGEISSYQMEKRYVRKDGRIVWILLTASLVRDRAGRPLYGIAQVQDITERREAMEAQQRLTAILEATPDVVGIADPHGHLLYLNRAGRELLHGGREPAGEHVSRFHPPDAARRLLLEGVPAALRDGVWSGETTLLDAGGRPIPASQVILGHRDADGELRYLSTVLRDLSGPKHAEERQRFLAESGKAMGGSLELADVLETLTCTLIGEFADYCAVHVTVDQEHRFAAAHVDPAGRDGVERLRAWPPGGDAAVGPDAVLRTGRGQLVPQVTPAWLQAVSRDEGHREALTALAPSSELIAPLRARGRVVGTVTCARVGRKEPYRDEDLPLLEELATRAGLAIDNARHYAQARAAVGVRDRVLRVVAHDLRNPLQAVSLSAQKLRLELPAEGDRGVEQRLDAIGRATRRAHRLVEDLLDLARVESGGLSVQPEVVDARGLVDEVVRLHRPQAEERGLRLEAEMPESLPAVRVDRDRLLQVFGNLVGNALKFVPAGGRVTVGAAPDEGAVRLWVADTGPGIAPEDRAIVFEPFWQAEDGARHGAGLGLAIARAIIEAHGGTLELQSAIGRGSTFSFAVPAARAHPRAIEPRGGEEAGRGLPPR
jgi:PAS domain S-box-containing protein